MTCNQMSNTTGDPRMDVMVRQVNLAAAIHDHISCTKISQQKNDMTSSGGQHVQHSLASLPCETDHIYASESKSNNYELKMMCNSNAMMCASDGIQMQRLMEMLLSQLDLIQHQQEQLLKKDRQLQALKQDREAMCLRLQKMEKRIAVLTAKVANSNVINNVVNSNSNAVICNNSTLINANALNVNIMNNNNTDSIGSAHDVDCDQSGSDTIIEDNNSVIGLFTDPTVFAKLYSSQPSSQSSQCSQSSYSTCNLSPNNVTNDSIVKVNKTMNKQKTDETESSMVKVKTEPIESEAPKSANTRKNRKRVSESSSSLSVSPNKKRSNVSQTKITKVSESVEIKKEPNISKNSSCDSRDSVTNSQCTKSSAKRKSQKEKCDSIVTNNVCKTSDPLNYKKHFVTNEILTTSKPYAININNSPQIKIEVNCDEKSQQTEDNIEVPVWRLHPVSSCYSLEGTENLDDEVFHRRHSKLENDERRRKRWDIQRLREQRHNERLRTGRYYSASLGNCFIEKPSDLKKTTLDLSFFPDIKNIQSIEVTEKLPIVAFGHPIPKLPLKPFSLPWIASADKTQSTNNMTAVKTRNTSNVKKHE